jgi:hypothetical protein
MAPSAVPPSMSVEAPHDGNALALDTHSQLRLSASGPAWRDMTEAQRQVLMPLRDRWDSIGALAKRRWLVLADRYPSMDASERNKLLSRMTTWASWSAQQRSQARINFESTKRLSAQELQAKWDEYQALSKAEKDRLADQARKAKKAKKAKQRKLAQIPAPITPAKQPTPATAAPPVVTPPASAVAEPAPVVTPSAAPMVHLPPQPHASSQPVVVPQSMPSVELPPLAPLPVHPISAPHTPAVTDAHHPTAHSPAPVALPTDASTAQ